MAATKKSKRNIEDDYSRTIARFMEKVAIQHGGGCWEWLAGKDKDGYGSFQYGGPRGEQKFEKRRAHRVSSVLWRFARRHARLPQVRQSLLRQS
jgi:hypothetical protein